jgi:hypothetical protein
VLAASLAVIAAAVWLACTAGLGSDPGEFSLLFDNVATVIAFFLGTGAMGWVMRKATAPQPQSSPAARQA